VNMGRAQLGQPEHGPKTGAQNTAQHEIIRAGLARPEERAGRALNLGLSCPRHGPHAQAVLGPARHEMARQKPPRPH